VYKPLPKPTLPLVSIQTGVAPAESVFVQTAWVGQDGNESAPSPINGQILTASSGFVVAMAEGALNAPPAAVAWNIYAGTTADVLTRQNPQPLAIGSTWTLPASGLIDGSQPLGGQQPNYYVTLSRQIQRG